MKERIFIDQLGEHKGEKVSVFGWVHIRRDHGKLIFLDLRDTTGLVQMVALPEHDGVIEEATKLRSEFVVEIEGNVNERPERMVKEGLNGDIEIEILNVKIISESETPPFELTDDTSGIDEEARLKYRYLDLRQIECKKYENAKRVWASCA